MGMTSHSSTIRTLRYLIDYNIAHFLRTEWVYFVKAELQGIYLKHYSDMTSRVILKTNSTFLDNAIAVFEIVYSLNSHSGWKVRVLG